MNIWFIIWVFIATFILGTSLWSYSILTRQKRAWVTVSKKCHLNYSAEAILKSPVLRGLYNGIHIDIFSDTAISRKFREGGTRTIFQLVLKAPMPCEGAIGSLVFKNFIDGLSLPDEFTGEGQDVMSKETYNRLKDKAAMVSYFTKERIAALNSVLSIKGMPAFLIFNSTDTILRIEATDPFDNAERLEKFLIKITEAAKKISL